MFDLFDEMSEKKETEQKGSEVDVEKLADIVAEKVLKKLSVTEPPKPEPEPEPEPEQEPEPEPEPDK